METIEIGPAPSEENCAQVGEENYMVRARRECRAFANQIARQYAPIPQDARIVVKSNRHDFGRYLEVAVCGPIPWVYDIEGDSRGVLQSWDDIALRELGLNLN